MITEEYFSTTNGAFFTEVDRLQKACGYDAIVTAKITLISKETYNVPMVLNPETNKATWVMKPYCVGGAVVFQYPNVDSVTTLDTIHENTHSEYKKLHIALERIASVELTCSKNVVSERANKQETAE